MVQTFLRRLAVALYRAPKDSKKAETAYRTARARATMGRYALYFFVTAGLFGFLGYLYFPELSSWKRSTPSVPIDPKAWRTSPATDADKSCGLETPVATDCAAHPGNPLIWTSRNDRYAHYPILRRWPKKDYWIGVEIAPERVAEARRLHANQLILGWVFGPFDVWVNGRFFVSTIQLEREPTVVALPYESLAPNQPMKIAVRIHPDSEMGSPDQLARPWKEGLATKEEVAAFRGDSNFWRRTMPVTLFALNLLFSLVFFLFWHVQRKKQEYFYIALFSSICAYVQVRFMDVFHGSFNIQQTWAIDSFLYVTEGGFGLLLAFSFARARKFVFSYGAPIFLIAPWVVEWMMSAFHWKFPLNTYLSKWFVPGCYNLGGFICALQAIYLVAENRKTVVWARIFRLLAFATGMFGMAVLAAPAILHLAFFQHDSALMRLSHFAIVFFLSALAIIEYRDERRLLDRSPLSKYHRAPELPAAVAGAILNVDLKSSERLFRHETPEGEGGALVSTCLSHVWSAVLHNKGTIIESEGDGLTAVFDRADVHDPVAAALRAADMMKQGLHSLHRQFIDQGVLPERGFLIEFRAAIAVGEIKPIWRAIDGLQVAGWIETGETNPFVESARLMEIERGIPECRDLSVVLLAQGVAAGVPESELKGDWIARGQEFKAKHDRAYSVDVYLPSAGLQARGAVSAVSAA